MGAKTGVEWRGRLLGGRRVGIRGCEELGVREVEARPEFHCRATVLGTSVVEGGAGHERGVPDDVHRLGIHADDDALEG